MYQRRLKKEYIFPINSSQRYYSDWFFFSEDILAETSRICGGIFPQLSNIHWQLLITEILHDLLGSDVLPRTFWPVSWASWHLLYNRCFHLFFLCPDHIYTPNTIQPPLLLNLFIFLLYFLICMSIYLTLVHKATTIHSNSGL